MNKHSSGNITIDNTVKARKVYEEAIRRLQHSVIPVNVEIAEAFRELVYGIANSRRSVCGDMEIYSPQISVEVIKNCRKLLERLDNTP